MKSYHSNFTHISLITCICIPLIISGCNSQTSSDQDQEESTEVLDPRIATIDSLKQAGYEIWDLHAHLKGGLTMDQLLAYSEKSGINYGVAVNAGVGFPVENDSALSAYYHAVKDYPVYHALQAEGSEWISNFSPDSID